MQNIFFLLFSHEGNDSAGRPQHSQDKGYRLEFLRGINGGGNMVTENAMPSHDSDYHRKPDGSPVTQKLYPCNGAPPAIRPILEMHDRPNTESLLELRLEWTRQNYDQRAEGLDHDLLTFILDWGACAAILLQLRAKIESSRV
ncbi:hypothetical protein RRG08_026823 [Elysia crispata]|uniref:Uncharacterized protein n=1 Tax=Elysia crispata TaxID=231223 RepID=A0AAE0ZH35_9GAST|nr:hypothetical protein RRG08_026823 [Elysia crispata]